VSPGAGNIIENTVTITHAANDPNTDNDSEEAIVIVNASESEESSIDLTIDKVADKSQASIMDNITYTLTYTNQ
jgi:hypothetical protein